jgi:hypothetical protein
VPPPCASWCSSATLCPSALAVRAKVCQGGRGAPGGSTSAWVRVAAPPQESEPAGWRGRATPAQALPSRGLGTGVAQPRRRGTSAARRYVNGCMWVLGDPVVVSFSLANADKSGGVVLHPSGPWPPPSQASLHHPGPPERWARLGARRYKCTLPAWQPRGGCDMSQGGAPATLPLRVLCQRRPQWQPDLDRIQVVEAAHTPRVVRAETSPPMAGAGLPHQMSAYTSRGGRCATRHGRCAQSVHAARPPTLGMWKRRRAFRQRGVTYCTRRRHSRAINGWGGVHCALVRVNQQSACSVRPPSACFTQRFEQKSVGRPRRREPRLVNSVGNVARLLGGHAECDLVLVVHPRQTWVEGCTTTTSTTFGCCASTWRTTAWPRCAQRATQSRLQTVRLS